MSDLADRAGDSVLGALICFYKPELVTIVQACGVDPKDFWRLRQRVVYRAILALHREGKHVDRLTVEAFLANHGWLHEAGGGAFLDLLVMSARVASFREHAGIVAENGRRDRLRKATAFFAQRVDAWDDPVGLREAFAVVVREMRAGAGQPSLRVVDGKEAA